MWLKLDITPLLDVFVRLSPSLFLSVSLSQAVNIPISKLCSCAALPTPYSCLYSGSLFLLCATTESSLKGTGDGKCETDAESKTKLVSFVVYIFLWLQAENLWLRWRHLSFLIYKWKKRKTVLKQWLIWEGGKSLLINLHFECILLFLHEDILNCNINGCLTYFWRSLNGPWLYSAFWLFVT